jgi:PAT family beta-lactamase induction signal transducer AmpG
VDQCRHGLYAGRFPGASQIGQEAPGSFYQAGVLGFGALSASLLVYLSSRVSQHVLELTAAALIGLPALAAFAAPLQQEISKSEFRVTMRRIGGEFKATFLRWDALPYIACMTFPFASGAAVGLLPGVAVQYGVDGDHVAWVNGLLGAFLMAAGSGAMSLVRIRMSAPIS